MSRAVLVFLIVGAILAWIIAWFPLHISTQTIPLSTSKINSISGSTITINAFYGISMPKSDTIWTACFGLTGTLLAVLAARSWTVKKPT
jgi:hypothetical protein